jgi:hypothetical protein
VDSSSAAPGLSLYDRFTTTVLEGVETAAFSVSSHYVDQREASWFTHWYTQPSIPFATRAQECFGLHTPRLVQRGSAPGVSTLNVGDCLRRLLVVATDAGIS